MGRKKATADAEVSESESAGGQDAGALTFSEAKELIEETADAATAATCNSAAEAQATLKSYGIESEVSDD